MTVKDTTKKSYELNAASREIKGRGLVKELFGQKRIPAVIYGKGFENKTISLKVVDFEKVVTQAKRSSIIDIIIDEKEHIDVLCVDMQCDFMGRTIHADFYKVNAKEELEAEVHLSFIGESPAKKAGLTIMFQLDEVKIKCLPKDLISEIVVDISKLEKVDDVIKVSDLNIPKNIKMLEGADEIVVIVHESEELDTKVDNTDEKLTAAQEAEAKEKEAKLANAEKDSDKESNKEVKKEPKKE